MRKTEWKGALLLLATALIWGAAFVAQSVGMEKIGAFTFSGVRTLMGAASLLPVIYVKDRMTARRLSPEQRLQKKRGDRKALVYGAILGVVFCAASNFQQFAFLYSNPGKIAFITALYIFFVPVFGLFLKRKPPRGTWACAALAFAGLYFLCVNPGDLGAINTGDVLSVVCAAFFAAHILLIERFSPDADGARLSCAQFLTAGAISCALMFIFEKPDLNAILSVMPALLYSGVMSCGVAYTLQIVGQKTCEATTASLLMCMESVFAVLAAALLLGDRLTGREWLGCGVMFAAIVLSQLAPRRRDT